MEEQDHDQMQMAHDEALTTDHAIDPVCGMTVNPATAAGSFEHERETYFFCSAHCLTAFREDPPRFLNRLQDSGTGVPPVNHAPDAHATIELHHPNLYPSQFK